MPEREAILLVRLDGVGDAALCIPALEGLRRAFPSAAFGAVCSPVNAALFSARIEWIHVLAKDAAPSALRDELAAVGYAKALVATEEVAGYELARMSGASERAGFWHRFHKPFKSLWQRSQLTRAVYRPAAKTKSPEHEVQTLYRLAHALGAGDPAPTDAADLRGWLRIEPSRESAGAAGAIGIQITPKWRSVGYTPSSVAAVLSELLIALPDERAAFIAAAADEDLAVSLYEHVAPGLKSRLQLISGLALPRWLGVVDALDTLVTPDTGAAHVAGMLGRRVIDVFDPSEYERLSRQWHPWAGSWRSHAKRPLDMRWDVAAYGRFLASEITTLRATAAQSPARLG